MGTSRHGLPKRLDGGQVDRVVRRSGGQELAQRVHHALVHHERPAVVRSGVDRLERDGVDLRAAGGDLRDGAADNP